jgi:hypothetical protein
MKMPKKDTKIRIGTTGLAKATQKEERPSEETKKEEELWEDEIGGEVWLAGVSLRWKCLRKKMAKILPFHQLNLSEWIRASFYDMTRMV